MANTKDEALADVGKTAGVAAVDYSATIDEIWNALTDGIQTALNAQQ